LFLHGAACVALVVLGAAAHADPASVVNALRSAGCAGAPPVGAPARRDSSLDAAARELARDAKLADALASVGYSAVKSASYHVHGPHDDAAIRSALEPRYCDSVNDPKLFDIGVHQSGPDIWIVLGGRTGVPFEALRDPAGVAQRVLALVNAARAEARSCGGNRFEPAPPLTMATALTAAASLHALDMAARGRLGHDGSDGSDSGERLTRAGYTWRAAGENVASGQQDAEAAVAAWLQSPGHCAALMDARFTDTGVAFALAPGKDPSVYWVQEFAAPL
jgi:uncharacterized protein YkwD